VGCCRLAWTSSGQHRWGRENGRFGQLPLVHVSHDDQVRRLAGKFRPPDRYANFGPLLQTMEIHGFRGVRSLRLPLESSIELVPTLFPQVAGP
jgi:hypothetical protein